MPAKVVKVTGLPSDATEESLADFFSFHGKILRTRVVGESGWLEFSTASEAKSSLLFDRTTFLGAKLRVSESDVDWSELPEDDGNESPPSRSEASSESTIARSGRPPPPRRAAARSGAAGGGRHRRRAAVVLVALRVLLDDARRADQRAGGDDRHHGRRPAGACHVSPTSVAGGVCRA